MMEQKRSRGRPSIPAKERKAKNFTFRGRPELHDKLRLAAKAGGRTVSDEIERRLSASFEATTAADEMGGRRLFGLLKATAGVMQNTGQVALAMNAGHAVQDDSWLDDPHSFSQAAAAAGRFLELCAPSVEPTSIVTTGLDAKTGAALQTAFQMLGLGLADSLAAEVSGRRSTNKARAEHLRDLLGQDIVSNLSRNIERGQP